MQVVVGVSRDQDGAFPLLSKAKEMASLELRHACRSVDWAAVVANHLNREPLELKQALQGGTKR